MTPEFETKRNRLVFLQAQLRVLRAEASALETELQAECEHEVILEANVYDSKNTRVCIVCALSETDWSFPDFKCRLHGTGSEVRKVDSTEIDRHRVLQVLKTSITT